MPPHYLLAAVGSTGDMHPFMSLTRALQGMGRQVSLMGPAFHAALVEKAGIPFIGLGTDADYLRVVANPELWHPRRGLKVLFGDYRKPLAEAFQALMGFQSVQPLIVVGHPFALPAIGMAKEKGLRARVVGAYLAPSNLRTVHDPLQLGDLLVPRWVPLSWRRALWRFVDRRMVDPYAGAELNAARAELGLPAVRKSFLLHMQGIPELSVGLFPPWFAPPQPDWPQPLLMGNFQLFDAAAHEPFSQALEEFLASGPAPIVVTPGTGNAHAAELFATAAQTTQKRGLRAIFLTRHQEQVPAHLPATMLWQPYVALSELLPRAAGLVHHGGIGTTAEAMRAGVPQLVTPFAWDQFDNAARVKALGVGMAVPAAGLNIHRLEQAFTQVFRHAATAIRCREIATHFHAARGPQTLCRDIESALRLAA
jgi:rhamnosyltransferase subunit B